MKIDWKISLRESFFLEFYMNDNRKLKIHNVHNLILKLAHVSPIEPKREHT